MSGGGEQQGALREVVGEGPEGADQTVLRQPARELDFGLLVGRGRRGCEQGSGPSPVRAEGRPWKAGDRSQWKGYLRGSELRPEAGVRGPSEASGSAARLALARGAHWVSLGIEPPAARVCAGRGPSDGRGLGEKRVRAGARGVQSRPRQWEGCRGPRSCCQWGFPVEVAEGGTVPSVESPQASGQEHLGASEGQSGLESHFRGAAGMMAGTAEGGVVLPGLGWCQVRDAGEVGTGR